MLDSNDSDYDNIIYKYTQKKLIFEGQNIDKNNTYLYILCINVIINSKLSKHLRDNGNRSKCFISSSVDFFSL